jgi:class 3 adenylate cyclase/WD40 repeat protein
VLGPMAHGPADDPSALGGPKQRAVLAMLIRGAGGIVPLERVINGVWGEDASPSLRSSVHTYVSNLRVVLGGRIHHEGNGYRLDAAPSEIDAGVFEQLNHDGRSMLVANPAKASESLRAALALWRGRPYADVADVPGLGDEIRRLESLRVEAVESRIDADLALGRHAVLIGELEALVAEHPLHEGLRARHMTALYRNGRQADALRAFQQTRDRLAEELGVMPGPELQRLEDRILQHDPNLLSPHDLRTEEVAFLFTDVAASTVLWETRPEEMREAMAVHDELLGQAVSAAGGRVFKHTGDGILAVFASVADAVQAATAAQVSVAGHEWGALGRLEIRMSVDAGEVDARAGDYFGAPMNRGSRLMASAHGGQVVLSGAAHDRLYGVVGVQVRNLGEHRFKGLGAPQPVFQLLVPGLPAEFPELRVDAAVPDEGRQFGDAIRGYELRERVGSGRFGHVYRAYQPSVGREVAVKVIRPEYANHPMFVRRFEAEARLVAKLAHPHIVPLFDFWRDPEGAYLVMPFLVGRSLSGGRYGLLPPARVAEIVKQVGSALAYAHRQGVIHRDVKPANVLLDADGNAYLADFGIAVRAVERATGLLPSSQTYRAPEDVEGGTVDERSDVYSLGALAAALLTGERPFGEETPAVPEQLRVVLLRALEVDPRERCGSIQEFVDAFSAAAGVEGEPAPPSLPVRNPYKGLAAFDEGDARDFFGRTGEVEALLELMTTRRMVTVVGPSGSGKSSLVRAGLIPALRHGRLPGSADWLVVTMVPGAHPFDELATVLGDVSTQSMGDLAAELRSNEHGLLRVGKRLMRELDGDLVLVVDQFEELFSLVADPGVRRSFAESLVEATEDPRSRVRVVTTVRADFYDQPLLDDRLGPVVSASNLALSVPAPDRLLEAVVRPATGAGLRLEPGLADRVVGDVRGEPGGLPLMQFVLSDLVRRLAGGEVTMAAYDEAGGVTGALSRRASDVLAGLDAADREVAEQVLLRMVSVSEDTDDVRRRVRRTELDALGFPSGSVDRVLDAFGAARLLTFDRDPITRGPTVEVAHESLLREWDVFREWVARRREALVIRRRFLQAMEDWETTGRADDHLPVGGRLAQFEEFAADSAVPLGVDELVFVSTAVERRERERADRRRRRRRVLAGFAGAAVLAAVLAVVALVQRGQAEEQSTLAEQARALAEDNAVRANRETDRAQQAQVRAERGASLAQARELVLEAGNVLEFDPELGLLLGLEAAEAMREAGVEPDADVANLFHQAIAADRLVDRFPGGRLAAVHPDGTLVATADGDGVAVWDIERREIVERYGRPGALAERVVFSPDGNLLAVTFWRSKPPVTVWDRRSGESFDLGAGEGTNAIDISPDGRLVAFVTYPPLATEVWSLSERRQVGSFEGAGLPDFGPNGELAISVCTDAGSCELRVVAPDSGAVQRSFSLDFDPLTAWSPTGDRIAVWDGLSIVVLDAITGDELSRTSVDRTGPPVWLASGRQYVSGGESVVRVIDAATGEVIHELLGQAGGSWDYQPLPNTERVVVSSAFGGTTAIYDLTPGSIAELGGWIAPTKSTWFTGYLEEGSRVFVGSRYDDVALVADALDGANARVWPATDLHGFQWVSRIFARRWIASPDADARWHVTRADDGMTVYTAPEGWSVRGVSNDGSKAIIHNDHLWDVDPDACPATRLVSLPEGTAIAELETSCDLRGSFFSPDGAVVVIATGDLVGPHVFDTRTGTPIADLADSRLGAGLFFGFTPNGAQLLVGTLEGPVLVADFARLLSGANPDDTIVKEIPAHDALVLNLDVSPDGSMVATTSWNEPVRVWDLTTGELVAEFGGELIGQAKHSAAFHPTLPHLVVATPPGQVRVYTLDLDELIEIARSRLSREMTAEECQLYLHRGCSS